MEMMWKGAVMAYLKALSQHLPEMAGKYGSYTISSTSQSFV
jgi:hypothetical protein